LNKSSIQTTIPLSYTSSSITSRVSTSFLSSSTTLPKSFSSIPYIYKDSQSVKTSQLVEIDKLHYFCEVCFFFFFICIPLIFSLKFLLGRRYYKTISL
jgi:hypothetical protein